MVMVMVFGVREGGSPVTETVAGEEERLKAKRVASWRMMWGLEGRRMIQMRKIPAREPKTTNFFRKLHSLQRAGRLLMSGNLRCWTSRASGFLLRDTSHFDASNSERLNEVHD